MLQTSYTSLTHIGEKAKAALSDKTAFAFLKFGLLNPDVYGFLLFANVNIAVYD